MKIRKLLSVTFVGLLSFNSWAQQAIDEVLDADKDSIVEIEHVAGEAEIIAWDKAQVKVSGTLGKDTDEYKFRRKGKTIELTIEVDRSGWSNWGGSIDGDELTIYVPANARVEYTTINASMTITGVKGGTNADLINGELEATDLEGKIRLETVNGDIRATDLNGDVALNAVNGDIRAENVMGEQISVSAVNGDIRFESANSEVFVETVNGDMDLTLTSLEEAKLNTVNGSISASLTLVEQAVVRASSVGGRIELEFDGDVQAKFDIEAHAGGRIVNNLTDDEPQKAKYGPSRWLKFSKGDPIASVDVSTVNGRVEVKTK